jgi:hypothetical protein
MTGAKDEEAERDKLASKVDVDVDDDDDDDDDDDEDEDDDDADEENIPIKPEKKVSRRKNIYDNRERTVNLFSFSPLPP